MSDAVSPQEKIMSIDTRTSIELRVLYGPQSGSRLPLSFGEYLLGSADECTIILAGLRMAARHALLIVDENGVRLSPQEGEVSDALGNALTGELTLTLGMPIELGGIAITVDQVEAAWPNKESVVPMARPIAPAPSAVPEAPPEVPADSATAGLQAAKRLVLSWRPRAPY